MHPLPKLGRVLTIDDFKPLEGETLMAETQPEPIALKLEKVVAAPNSASVVREPFTLVFSTPMNALLVEGHYRIAAGRMGVVEIHMMPTQTLGASDRRFYHASFN